jgi:TonB family protein
MSNVNSGMAPRWLGRVASAFAIGALAASPRVDAQTPAVPLGTAWPARIAVGMRQGDQLSPFTVEARDDGWVIVTVLSTRPDVGLAPPTMRLVAEARDVRRWTTRIRALFLDDSAATNGDGVLAARPVLGNGRFRIEVGVRRPASRETLFSVYGCGPGSATSQPSRAALADLLELLDSAATRAGGGGGRPPTLQRPYYASEVSCPASPAAENAPPVFPSSVSRSERRPVEIGVGFVVDTAGSVERGSLAFLPGTDPRLARATRQAIARWRFLPAEWDGKAIRQVVQTRITFSPNAAR